MAEACTQLCLSISKHTTKNIVVFDDIYIYIYIYIYIPLACSCYSDRVDYGIVYTERRVQGRQSRLWKEHSEDGIVLKLPNS